MDSISQAALGAALGGVVAGRVYGRAAIIGGAALATLPDLDVVISYGTAIANYTYHRGFSHSLLVLVPVAIILALLLSRRFPDLSRRRWLTFTLLILVTHPLLDTLTTYGTQLFWPLLPPLGTNSIFIIDPLYTLPLLVTIVIGLLRPPAIGALAAGLTISTLYLGWALTAQQVVSQRMAPVLAEEGLSGAPTMIQPMPFNTVLWRVTVIAEDQRLETAVSVFDGLQPPVIERFAYRRDLLNALTEFPEGRRLIWFTGEFLDVHIVANELRATDIRLGVPSAHPFTFVLAERAGPGAQWHPVTSRQSPRPSIRSEAAGALFQRLSGRAPVLCLSNLATSTFEAGCPGS